MDDYSRAICGYMLFLGAPSALNTGLALRQGIWPKACPGWPMCAVPDVLCVDQNCSRTRGARRFVEHHRVHNRRSADLHGPGPAHRAGPEPEDPRAGFLPHRVLPARGDGPVAAASVWLWIYHPDAGLRCGQDRPTDVIDKPDVILDGQAGVLTNCPLGGHRRLRPAAQPCGMTLPPVTSSTTGRPDWCRQLPRFTMKAADGATTSALFQLK